MIKRLSIAALLATTCVVGAHASESQFNSTYCAAASCDGSTVSNASIWQQLRMLGTTEFLGGRMGNTFVDESALRLPNLHTIRPVSYWPRVFTASPPV